MEINFTSEQIEFLREKDLANTSIKEILEEVEHESTRTFSFWELISQYHIQIPIIQRDYAQGRNDEKTVQIREGFINAIHDCLNGSGNLHLDFIYGSAADGENLVLLDGQQRITTLFLLHWYIANRTKQISLFSETFLKFSYKTRISSKDFCEALIKHPADCFEDNLYKQITNENWFFRSWQKDPTVKAMLIMIDAIHLKFKDWSVQQFEDAWKKLAENQIINFQFLDLDEFDLTDELYIKMNARGKALTEFENFKAWLIQRTENDTSIEFSSWPTKLDTIWTDLFWTHKADADFEIDTEMMQYFKGFALNCYAEKIENGSLKDAQKDFITKFNDGEYIPFSEFEKTGLLASVDSCLKLLSFLEGDNIKKIKEWLNTEQKSIFKTFIDKPNYWNRVTFYALSQFLLQNNQQPIAYSDIEIKQLKEWMRVCRNLIQNTQIDDQSRFADAIKSIKSLSKYCDDIYTYLAQSTDEISSFSLAQKEDEKLKAELIKENPSWEELLVRYERHDYFYGQLGFLINYSEVEGKYNIERFKFYAEKASFLFDNYLDSKEFDLDRALLVKKDYMLQLGNRWRFCLPNKGRLRDREENWRRIFRDPKSTVTFKALLDDPRSLGDIIEDGKIIVTNWRSHFIKHPELLEYCNQRLIRWLPNDDIRLLGSSGLNHYHAELRSYAFYIGFIIGCDITDFTPFNKTGYFSVKGGSNKPCAVIDNWKVKGHDFAMDIYYHDGKYKIRFFDRNEKEYEEEIVTCLRKDDMFELDASYGGVSYSRLLETDAETYNEIKSLCTSLQKLQMNKQAQESNIPKFEE